MTADTYLPRIGGAEIHVANLRQKLIERGHQVKLLTTEPGNNEQEIIRIPWKRNYFELLSRFWRLSSDVDLIHSHYCYRLAFFVGIIAKLRRKPFIITLHGYGILNHPGTPWYFQLVHSLYRFWSLHFATLIISTSRDLARHAEKYISSKKIVLISNGVDFSKFSQIQDTARLRKKYKDAKIILTVRRLTPKCGIQYLVEAMPHILRQEPSAYYIMIGDGVLREEIKKRIQILGIKDKVEMLGTVPNENVLEYLAFADVVVFPSTAESTSIACIEAMAMGKPIVASRVGGLIELLGENERGLLVKMFDWETCNYEAPLISEIPNERYEALAQGIITILKDRDLANKLGSRAKEYAKHFDWEQITIATENVYYQAGERR